MARYINADILSQEIDKLQSELQSNNDAIWNINKPIYKGLCYARGIINDIPTADVVEVVRCKDCRYWEEIGIDPITDYTFGYCRHYQWQDEENSRETNGQDYCSYGERREE